MVSPLRCGASPKIQILEWIDVACGTFALRTPLLVALVATASFSKLASLFFSIITTTNYAYDQSVSRRSLHVRAAAKLFYYY